MKEALKFLEKHERVVSMLMNLIIVGFTFWCGYAVQNHFPPLVFVAVTLPVVFGLNALAKWISRDKAAE